MMTTKAMMTLTEAISYQILFQFVHLVYISLTLYYEEQ